MKKGRLRDIALAGFLTCTLMFIAVALILRPRALDIAAVDLNMIADGEYIGVCRNKLLLAVVKVEVNGHQIVDIEIIEHKEAYMRQAEMIAGTVVDEQTLEVDAVSGATLTGDTVLKAVENALMQGVK